MLEKLPFHQYQRYKNLQRIINSIRNKQEEFSILEVGAGTHFNAERFLPLDHFIYLDPVVPEGFTESSKLIVGDACALEFSDNSSDFVVALDVYEHIPKEDRHRFLKEISRVSKYGIILSAPFLEHGVIAIEEGLARFSKTLNSEVDIIWLNEHQEMGLPDLKTTKEFLEKEMKLNLFCFNHGNYGITDSLLALELISSIDEKVATQWQTENFHYNTEIFAHDFDNNGTRTFIVATKDEELLERFLRVKKDIVSDYQYEDLYSKVLELETKLCWAKALRRERVLPSPGSKKKYRFQVDVLLVSYNQEKHIGSAIESILMQKTNFDYRIVVCDDCSTDGTMQVILEYAKVFPDLFYIMKNESNVGVTKNYQRGFAECKGKYVAVLEGDDFWNSHEKLQKQVDFLETHKNCSMCFNRLWLYMENEQCFSDHNLKDSTKLDRAIFMSGSDLAYENFIGNFSSCMYRLDFLRSIDPAIFDMIAYDWAINLAISCFGDLGVLNEKLSTYRVHSNGVWSNSNSEAREKKMLEVINLYDRFFDYQFFYSFNRLRLEITSNHEIKK